MVAETDYINYGIGSVQMDNNELLKKDDSFLGSGESDTGMFTIDMRWISNLPLLYKMIDGLKDDQNRFINYGTYGDVYGQ